MPDFDIDGALAGPTLLLMGGDKWKVLWAVETGYSAPIASLRSPNGVTWHLSHLFMGTSNREADVHLPRLRDRFEDVQNRLAGDYPLAVLQSKLEQAYREHSGLFKYPKSYIDRRYWLPE